jgi:hypothetical protein
MHMIRTIGEYIAKVDGAIGFEHISPSRYGTPVAYIIFYCQRQRHGCKALTQFLVLGFSRRVVSRLFPAGTPRVLDV